MRDRKGVIWLVGLVVIGVAAAAVINVSIHSAEKMVTVFTAASTIPDDTVITRAEITTTQTPSTLVPAGAITDLATVIGHYADATIAQGEPILQSVVAPASTVRQLVRVYGMNYVGAAVQLSSSDLPITIINAGDLVDLAGVYGTQQQQVYTQWVAQGVPVLSVDTANDRIVLAIPESDALTLVRDLTVGKVRVLLDPQPFKSVSFGANTSSSNTVPAIKTTNTSSGKVIKRKPTTVTKGKKKA
jgi:Flp pilus assembly protein CpaB